MIRHKITRMTANTYALESMSYLTAGLIDDGVDYRSRGVLQGLRHRGALGDDHTPSRSQAATAS